jgi:uncharacterized protein YgiM (DUF1202 family)
MSREASMQNTAERLISEADRMNVRRYAGESFRATVRALTGRFLGESARACRP